MDNLLAEKKVVEMLIVMDQGYAIKASAEPIPHQVGNEAFEEVVIKDLVPMIDSTYRTIAKRDARAIAGLSMGGGQAVSIGFGHADLFASVAALSGGAASRGAPRPVGAVPVTPGSARPPNSDEALRAPAPAAAVAPAQPPPAIAAALANPKSFNAKTQLFWVGSGQQDGGYERSKEAHEALENAGVRHIWFEVSGAHEWQVWRKSLYDLAPRLFREAPKQ